MSQAKYAVGIDLGTTHCVVAALALGEPGASPELFPIIQLVAPGQLEARDALPSFLYLPNDSELAPELRRLPWGDSAAICGQLARERGAKSPNRLVSSAKSWLCHGQLDRRAGLLPLQAAEDVTPISPYDASLHYLNHLVAAWQEFYPEAPLAEQQITLTVPASFDPSARELTAEAARAAGLGHATLLEEPQAALYHWLAVHAEQWREQVQVGDCILVVDVGGGTTDLSLISVRQQDGALALERIAVGEHLLLGGDNMDLALANVIRMKLAQQGTQLQPWQILALAHGCRQAKEQLFAEVSLERAPIVVPSRSSSLIGGSLRTELTRAEIEAVLLEGFFPAVAVTDPVQQRPRAALTTLSLPYAQDAAITRHLAAFLTRQREALPGQSGQFVHPTAVLFNGGVMKAAPLVARLESVLNGWLAADGAPPVRRLTGTDPDQAVARGAAYYGGVRAGQGIRIRGGTACSYYVGIESALPTVPGLPPMMQALCIAPFGMEEGSACAPSEAVFALVVGEPVRFHFYSSTVRREDVPGSLLEFWAEGALDELPPIEALLSAEGHQPGELVQVRLQAAIDELGTLQLEAVSLDGSQRWKVQFDTRGQAC
ncbi:Hsp70 family protein [Pseudaeromonas sp. ZJS20]|uniref:Hsp70 family protein n=1 Tax=Pseudaeromonas aegiceratis TaxID=3153928 RepID=UPI00390C3FF0